MPNLLIETLEKPITLEIVEGKGNKLVARGEFGRVGVPTANGRNYPEKLMQREIDRLSEDLKNRSVLGELDHPCLTTDDFRVLTVGGWKPFREIAEGDRVWSRVNGKTVLSVVCGIVDEPYSGPVYHVKGRSLEGTFTPAHKFLLVNRNGKEEMVTVAEIADNPGKYNHHAVPKTAEWVSEDIANVVIPGVKTPRVASAKNDVSKDLVLDSSTYAAFMGIYLSEGCCSADSVDNYDVNICQKNQWSKKYIYDEILSKFPSGLDWRETSDGYSLADARLYEYLKPIGDAYNKYIPAEAKKLKKEDLQELLYWFAIGDGRMVRSDGRADRPEGLSKSKTEKEEIAESLRGGNLVPFTRQDVFSVSKRLIDDLHECLVRAGGAGSVSSTVTTADYYFAGHLIKAENKVPLYSLHISHSKNVWMDSRFVEIDREEYDGNIYCLSVDNGNFYMEIGGHSFWTGNSDGKTSFKRVSHVITGLKIVNGVVIGEAEILNTREGVQLKALIEGRIPLGISSRGYGSTQASSNPEEGEVVQDDFVLKTYDFVCDPAVRTATPEIFTEDIDDHTAGKMFLAEFPEIAAEIMKQAEAGELTESKVSDKIKEAKDQVRKEMQESFEKQLASVILEAKEEMSNELREEYSKDPDIGGAKATLSQIAEMLRPYIATPEEKTLSDAMKAKDLEVAEAKSERDEAVEKAKEAAWTLHLERKVKDHPMAESVTKLVKPKECDSLEELNEKIEVVIADLPEVDDDDGRVTEEEAGMRETVAQLEGEKTLLESKVDELTAKLKKAVVLGERIDEQRGAASLRVEELEKERDEAVARATLAEEKLGLEVYKHEKVVGLTNGRELLALMEDVTSKAAVDKVVKSRGATEIADGELATMRDKLFRGISDAAGMRQELTEDNKPPSGQKKDDLGNDMDEMRQLAGIAK